MGCGISGSRTFLELGWNLYGECWHFWRWIIFENNRRYFWRWNILELRDFLLKRKHCWGGNKSFSERRNIFGLRMDFSGDKGVGYLKFSQEQIGEGLMWPKESPSVICFAEDGPEAQKGGCCLVHFYEWQSRPSGDLAEVSCYACPVPSGLFRNPPKGGSSPPSPLSVPIPPTLVGPCPHQALQSG